MDITDKTIREYLDGFYKPQTAALAALRAEAESENVPVILKSSEELLRALLAVKKPRSLLEIGAAVGYSACFFAEAGAQKVVTVEKDESLCERAAANVRSMELSQKVRLLRGEALDNLRKLGDEGAVFDFLFIDAAKSHYGEFWDAAMPLLADGALIVCDNVLMRGITACEESQVRRKHWTSMRRMKEFLARISELPYVRTSLLAVGDGAAVSIFDKAAYERYGKCETHVKV